MIAFAAALHVAGSEYKEHQPAPALHAARFRWRFRMSIRHIARAINISLFSRFLQRTSAASIGEGEVQRRYKRCPSPVRGKGAGTPAAIYPSNGEAITMRRPAHVRMKIHASAANDTLSVIAPRTSEVLHIPQPRRCTYCRRDGYRTKGRDMIIAIFFTCLRART